MNPTDTDRLLALLDGTLAPADAEALRRRLDAEPNLRAELEALRGLRGLLRTTVRADAEVATRPFLADRVMRRLAAPVRRLSPEEELLGGLLRLFRPVAVAGLLLILALAAYNVTLATGYVAAPSTAEAVLGLPPVSLTTAYDVDYAPLLPE